MDDCVGQMRKLDGSLQKPVAYLTCNFNRPVNGKPALFTHDEVITLFHEFGHGLHHMLTRIDTAGVSGISGVPWDAVELPSQFMENWCWEPEALAFISGHYETGEPPPQELLEKMLAAKTIRPRYSFCVSWSSACSTRLHAEYKPEQGAKILETLAEIKSRSPWCLGRPGGASHMPSAIFLPGLCGRLLQLSVGRCPGGGCLLALKKRGFSIVKPASRSSITF